MPLRSHTLDIYGAEIHLATTKREWSTMRRRFDSLTADDAAAVGSTSLVIDTVMHIPVLCFWLDVGVLDSPADRVQTVSHEAAHGAGMLLDHLGQRYDGESEAHAYLVGWLAMWLWGQAWPG